MKKGYVLFTILDDKFVGVWNGEIHSTPECCLNSLPENVTNAWGPFEINVPENFHEQEPAKGKMIDLGLLSVLRVKE